MIYIGDDVEICIEKGGECVVKCQEEPVAGIQEISLSLVPGSRKGLCKIFPLPDKAAYAQQLLFASEMVRAGFSVEWTDLDEAATKEKEEAKRQEVASMLREVMGDRKITHSLSPKWAKEIVACENKTRFH